MEKEFVDKTMGKQNEWYAQARTMKTKEELSDFIVKLMEGYSHDSETVCHAMTAGALAALAVMNKFPEGGIANDQAQKILTLFIKMWAKIDGPAKLTQWEGLLHPANKLQFTTIPRNVFAIVQKTAQDMINGDMNGVPQEVVDHIKSVAEGNPPWGLEIMEDVIERGTK